MDGERERERERRMVVMKRVRREGRHWEEEGREVVAGRRWTLGYVGWC